MKRAILFAKNDIIIKATISKIESEYTFVVVILTPDDFKKKREDRITWRRKRRAPIYPLLLRW